MHLPNWDDPPNIIPNTTQIPRISSASSPESLPTVHSFASTCFWGFQRAQKKTVRRGVQIFQGVHRGGPWGNYLWHIPKFLGGGVHSFGIGGRKNSHDAPFHRIMVSWKMDENGGFLKWWYPTTMGFPTKNDHFGVFWGYPYLWKHPYLKGNYSWRQHIFSSITVGERVIQIEILQAFHHDGNQVLNPCQGLKDLHPFFSAIPSIHTHPSPSPYWNCHTDFFEDKQINKSSHAYL